MSCDNCSGECSSKINIQPKDTSIRHFYVSLVKSVLRVLAGVLLIMEGFQAVGWIFIIAEALGVLEELV